MFCPDLRSKSAAVDSIHQKSNEKSSFEKNSDSLLYQLHFRIDFSDENSQNLLM